MSKRYLHSADGSKIVEDGSTEMIELLSGGTWFKSKAEVETPVSGEADTEENEIIVRIKELEQAEAGLDKLSDQELNDLYTAVDTEMDERGLFGEDPETEVPTEGTVIDLDALSDEDLKALGQKYKVASFASMKRETLIEALKGVHNA